jgi:hypothetical protein
MIYKYQNIKAIPSAIHNAADTLGVYLPKLAELDEFLTKLISDGKHQFIGMRVLRHGQLIFNGAYGTQTPNGAPLLEDAIYPMQSVTKTFTATYCRSAERLRTGTRFSIGFRSFRVRARKALRYGTVFATPPG